MLAVAAVVMAVFAGCAAAGTPGTVSGVLKDIQTNIIENVSDSEAKSIIAATSDMVILDVRMPEEFSTGHLENAINVDFKASSFKNELGKLDKNKSYLVYCRTGKRSAESARIMTELGFSHISNLLGGITQWQTEGGAVVK